MSARRTWTLFALFALAGCGGLAWLTHFVLARSRATAEAAIAAQLAEDERSALARMDLLFAPLLARAAARAEDATALGGTYRVEIPSARLVEQSAVEPSTALKARADAVWAGEGPHVQPLTQLPDRGAGLEPLTQRGVARSQQEYQARANSNLLDFGAGPGPPPLVFPPLLDVQRPAALVPDWDGASGVLTFARRVGRQGDVGYQALRFDWPALEVHLLSVVGDLFPDAHLEPIAPDAPPSGDRLATLPARLVVPRELPAAPLDHGLVAALGGAWLLALLAATGAAFALRASLADAARQRRFTAAVTHELRTPLTTFRLYGDMLARGMVPPERQGEYLATIEREAGRLGGLVENVLAYARLEQGHTRPARERVSLDALVERHRASLEQRCRRAGTMLALELGSTGEVELATDVEGVGLVLTNLVDNACKYGAPAGGHAPEHPIRLRASVAPATVALSVEDDGPGVAPALRATVFRPFERGGRDESDPAPGVGLGLTLAREVARALGGELTLEPGPGARFVLHLPRI